MTDILGCDEAAIGAGIAVCVVEDDHDLREELVLGLGEFGFSVRGFSCSREFYHGLLQSPCDVAIVDLGLPDEDGLVLVERLRELSAAGIVILSGRRHLDDRVRGLMRGADAYLTKPVDLRELVATLISVCRRAGAVVAAAPEPAAPASGWELAQDGWSLQVPGGALVALTPSERVLLQNLFDKTNQTVARDVLVTALGHRADYYLNHRLDMLVSRLRRKVRAATGQHLPLRAVRGAGFMLSPSRADNK